MKVKFKFTQDEVDLLHDALCFAKADWNFPYLSSDTDKLLSRFNKAQLFFAEGNDLKSRFRRLFHRGKSETKS